MEKEKVNTNFNFEVFASDIKATISFLDWNIKIDFFIFVWFKLKFNLGLQSISIKKEVSLRIVCTIEVHLRPPIYFYPYVTEFDPVQFPLTVACNMPLIL